MSETMIETIGLDKFYGPFAAVRDVTFSVPKKQVCGFLGPNGAGKSTTMKLLTGFIAPTAGTVKIAGFDMESVPRSRTWSIVFKTLQPDGVRRGEM